MKSFITQFNFIIRERFLLQLVVASCILALSFSFFLNDQFNIYLIMLIPLSLLGFYISSIMHHIRIFSEKKLKKEIFFVETLLENIEESIKHHEYNTKHLIQTIDQIANSNFDFNETVLDGEIGTAIRNLQEKLKKIRDEEQQRSIITQGIATIGDIRKNDSDIHHYAHQVVHKLIRFLNAQQAAFYQYSTSDQKQLLELLATYACDHLDPNEHVIIEFGNGLLGQCARTREIISICNLPENYLKIGSGLGASTPKCITIVPLVYKDQLWGIIELASFHSFKSYLIEFLEHAAESIASEIADLKREEAMILKSKELELQLKMVQSERMKNIAILEGCVDAVISFNEQGKIQFINKMTEEIFGYDRNELLETHITRLVQLTIEHDGKDKYLTTHNDTKVTVRTEINAFNKQGEEITLLLTSTHVDIDEGTLFTLFAQKISVDLF